MLNSILSEYFIRNMFFYIYNKRQLKLVRYNKKLQQILHVNLDHFKIYSDKYILYKGVGLWKEYTSSDDRLIYEGEYLDGQRNGFGKEYDKKGKIIFEGEYINGKRWDGTFKTYYDNGNILFDCEYVKGKINGVGYDINKNIVNFISDGKMTMKEYDEVGELIYEGEYLNFKKNGLGKQYYFDKLIFEGEYLNGKRWNGKGYDINNQFAYELNNGKGYVKAYESRFEGEFLYGERNGKGKEYDFDGKLFEGNYINNVKSGEGKNIISMVN